MGCIQLHILDRQYKNTELKVSYTNKKLTLNNSAVKERREILVKFIDPDGMRVNPYYDAQTGIFLGVDEKGFKGLVMVTSREAYYSAVKNKNGTVNSKSINQV